MAQSDSALEAIDAFNLGNYPPRFWDKLSHVWLTPRSLRELDRRTRHLRDLPAEDADQALPPSVERFARVGGPDFSYLRGKDLFSHVDEDNCDGNNHDKGNNGHCYSNHSNNQGSNIPAFDECLEQWLQDYGIHLGEAEIRPGNLGEIQNVLRRRPGSINEPRFRQQAFEKFTENVEGAQSKLELTGTLHHICRDPERPFEQAVVCSDLAPLTPYLTLKIRPDLYDGAYPGDLDRRIKQDPQMLPLIVPFEAGQCSVVPNFFVHIPDVLVSSETNRIQAAYEGVHGARAMSALQNYGRAGPQIFDGNAYSFSAVYEGYYLTLYAHHIAASGARGGTMRYHTTKIGMYNLIASRVACAEGVSAFRRLRELARRYRNEFILAANSRVPVTDTSIYRDSPLP